MSIDCILNRRSVRRYTNEPVSKEDLHTLLRAGMAAPSAANKRPWEFVVIEEQETRTKLSTICPYWTPAAHAPLVVVVCGNTTSGDEIAKMFFVQDCSCVSENILCAATGIGLGAVWLGVYGIEERMRKVAELIGLPEGVYPVSVLAIGHPDQKTVPHDSYDEERVHFGRY